MDVARIAFVTRRFHELHGFATAVFGCGLVLSVVVYHAGGGLYQPHPMQMLNFANMMGAMAMTVASRLYRYTFGDPVAPARTKILGGLLIIAVMAGGLADMWAQIKGRQQPSMAAVVLASYAMWILARDWRWRLHYLVAAAAGLMGALVTAGVPATLEGCCSTPPARTEAYLLCYTLVGLGLVVVGLMDHRLLASSLAPSGPNRARPQGAIERSANGLTQAAAAAFFCFAAGGMLAAASPASLAGVLALGITLALLGTLLAVMIVPLWSTWHQAAQQLVSFQRDRAAPITHVVQPTWQLRTDSLALLGLVAFAAAVDAWILPSGAPSVLGLSIAFSSGWVAIRDWRHRPYYLVGAVAALVASLLGAGMPPAKSFLVLVLAVSGSLVVEGLLDYWVPSRRDSGPDQALSA